MLTLPITDPPGELPIIRRNYPADRNHYTLWRRNYQIEYIILHNTEGRDSRAYLSTKSGTPPDPPDRRVSIHKLVRHDGVYSIVPPAHTAWHCGETIADYTHMNERSLGVEIESINHNRQCQEPYSDSDYNFTAHTLAGWMFSYGLGWERVLCHRDIANPPGRRDDPSGLDLARLQREVYAWLRFFRGLKVTEHAKWII